VNNKVEMSLITLDNRNQPYSNYNYHKIQDTSEKLTYRKKLIYILFSSLNLVGITISIASISCIFIELKRNDYLFLDETKYNFSYNVLFWSFGIMANYYTFFCIYKEYQLRELFTFFLFNRLIRCR